MLNQGKKILKQFKDFWDRQAKKRKILMLCVLGGIVMVSVLLAVLLNTGKDGYVALYTGLETTESTEIYKMLQDMSVPAKIDSSGQILVLDKDKDMLLIQLAALGYPKSAPSYDIFTSNAGLTTTEFEKKQYLLFQLQERIAKTIMHIEGVKNAIVTLVVPEESNYVWDSNSNQKSSASVLITMKDGVRLSSDKIAGIKNLIASAVPKMKPEDVILVDAATSLEMNEEDTSEKAYNTSRLDFESQIEQSLINKVKEVLSLAYSEDEMRVAATVVIDYSRMITEQMQYKPEDNGYGVPNHLSERYVMGAEDVASGIPGEETNTDVPIYVDSDDDGVPDTVYYVRDIDFFVSYIKQQIEKDNTQLVDASVAVSLKDGAMTERRRENIVSLVSDATNVPEENITVYDLLAPVVEEEPEDLDEQQPPVGLLDQFMPFIIIGAGILAGLIVILIVVLIVVRSVKKRKAKKQTEAEMLEAELEEALKLEEEEQRKKLRDAALASVNQENMITQEVKQFANENPEITASLIRSWLKEGE